MELNGKAFKKLVEMQTMVGRDLENAGKKLDRMSNDLGWEDGDFDTATSRFEDLRDYKIELDDRIAQVKKVKL